jgi:hypothetical protein
MGYWGVIEPQAAQSFISPIAEISLCLSSLIERLSNALRFLSTERLVRRLLGKCSDRRFTSPVRGPISLTSLSSSSSVRSDVSVAIGVRSETLVLFKDRICSDERLEMLSSSPIPVLSSRSCSNQVRSAISGGILLSRAKPLSESVVFRSSFACLILAFAVANCSAAVRPLASQSIPFRLSWK